MGNARQHEGVLHVDHDQRGLRRIEIVVGMLPAAALGDAVDDGFGNCEGVHGFLQSPARAFSGEVESVFRPENATMRKC
jgi:hypothetical protein